MAYLYNIGMKLSARDLVKLLLSKENLTQKELAELITERTGKKQTPDGLSRKLKNDPISHREIPLIPDILGYDISIERKQVKK